MMGLHPGGRKHRGGERRGAEPDDGEFTSSRNKERKGVRSPEGKIRERKGIWRVVSLLLSEKRHVEERTTGGLHAERRGGRRLPCISRKNKR